MHSERRPDIGSSQPESEIRLSQRSADFASSEGVEGSAAAEAAPESVPASLTPVDREPQPTLETAHDVAPLDEAEVNRLVEDIDGRLKRADLSPEDRSDLATRRHRLESHRNRLELQAQLQNVDADLSRRTDEFEGIVGVSLAEDAPIIAPPLETGLPPKTVVSEKQGAAVQAHLKDAKHDRVDKFAESTKQVDEEIGRIDEIIERSHELNQDAGDLMADVAETRQEVLQAKDSFESTLKAGYELVKNKKVAAGGNVLAFLLRGELPKIDVPIVKKFNIPFFGKKSEQKTDPEFTTVREQLKSDLDAYVQLVARKRTLGYHVEAPSPLVLEAAGISADVIPPVSEAASIVKQAKAINEEVRRGKDEIATIERESYKGEGK